MAGQEKDQFEGLGEFAKYFRGNPFFNPESAQQQKQEEMPRQPQQPTGQKPAEQPGRIGRLVAEHFQGLEGILAGEEESYRQRGQQLDTALLDAQKSKGSALTPQEIKDISDSNGIGLSSYLFCGMNPPEDKSKFGVFWNGDERAPLPAKYVPRQWLEGLLGKENATYFCPNHIVFISINAMYKGEYEGDMRMGRYTSHEALVIEPWRKIQNPEEANARLKELGLADVELLPYTEKTLRNGELGERGMQALVFPAEKYTEHQKRQALARLRGEQPEETTGQPQASYTTAPAEAQKPQTPPQPAQIGGIEGLLPQGGTEERLLPGGRIEVTKMTLEIAYDGNPANFEQIRYLNSVLQAAGLDCSIDPNDPQKVEFRVRNYLERPEATKEVEDKLRILVLLNHLTAMHVSSSIEDFVNRQVKDPAMRARLLGELPSYMSQQGRISGQQTL